MRLFFKINSIFVALCLVFMVSVRSYSQSACINQSPRNVKYQPPTEGAPPAPGLDYNFWSTAPVVDTSKPPATIEYQGQTLRVCDQHYHVPVENIQGCPHETEGKPPEPGKLPEAGQWIEVHTVYALEVDPNCGSTDNNLTCCKMPPFVVRGFSAEVTERSGTTSSSVPLIITPKNTRPLVEWSGSNTGPDDSTGCKPLPAQWNFNLGCQFTVPKDELAGFKKAHDARQPQPPNRVSPDMTLVGNTGDVQNGTCREVRTDPLKSAAIAHQDCPVACRPPLSTFDGNWKNFPSNDNPQYGLCTCCAPNRLQ
ncbi:MAG TPA: hypothetical protein VFB76_13470 [Candidatus Angelobacter sp.]|nr:hypothetical protein [Candidatus Angelobacter sp.]